MKTTRPRPLRWLCRLTIAGALAARRAVEDHLGHRTYTNLHGRGYQVVDNYTGSPATFVLKGTVTRARD